MANGVVKERIGRQLLGSCPKCPSCQKWLRRVSEQAQVPLQHEGHDGVFSYEHLLFVCDQCGVAFELERD